MSPRFRRPGRTIFVVVACFYAGLMTGWWLHAAFAPEAPASPSSAAFDGPGERQPDSSAVTASAAEASRAEAPPALPADDRRVATTGTAGPRIGGNPVAELRRRSLRVPVDGVDVSALEGDFYERRGGGSRGHEAVDILAPRHTPIHAVESGTIARLFKSAAGGITIYQFDLTSSFCYYYAHLDRYAEGLREGQQVQRGDVLGYVGTTGNAPPNTPHLHFAIFELTPDKRWWEGKPLDPYKVFAGN
jgi:murein DD-endopeptidase MepM/ murein hydrolase activator NlpD